MRGRECHAIPLRLGRGMRPSRAPSTTKSVIRAIASGWFRRTPRARRFRATIAATLIFPIIGMIADKRRYGRVHPAWFWGVGTIVAVQIASDLVAYSEWGLAFTRDFLSGTPGAERPMEAFIPPGFAM